MRESTEGGNFFFSVARANYHYREERGEEDFPFLHLKIRQSSKVE